MFAVLALVTLAACTDYIFSGKPDIPLPDTGSPADPLPCGKVLTLLLTMSDAFVDRSVSEPLLVNAAAWLAPSDADAPRFLVLRDDNTGDENADDADYIVSVLQGAGYDTTLADEPADGVGATDIEGFDVVILSNPGDSPDDIATLDALYAYSVEGHAIVFQGDDMAHFDDPAAFDMASLTRLYYVDNGTTYGGYEIDDDAGDAYEVTVGMGHPVTTGLEGQQFRYGNDIDTTQIDSDDVVIVGMATVENTTLDQKPVIAAYEP